MVIIHSPIQQVAIEALDVDGRALDDGQPAGEGFGNSKNPAAAAWPVVPADYDTYTFSFDYEAV